MRDKLKTLAAKHGRSTNSEILDRLERSLATHENAEIEPLRQMIRDELRAALTSTSGKR
jgi:plasmid stability protein